MIIISSWVLVDGSSPTEKRGALRLLLFLWLLVVAGDFVALHGEVLGEGLCLLVVEVQPDGARVGVRAEFDSFLEAVFQMTLVHEERCHLLHVLSCLLVLVELREYAEAVTSEDVAYSCSSVFVDVHIADAVFVVPCNHNLGF